VLRQFYKERDVVMEERRMRTDNDPQGKMWEALVSSAFWASPYQMPTIGWMSDLKRLTRDDANC
jgi:predicted Zn-dependent peptidase